MPKNEYILETVLRQYRTVTGREPDGVGTILPGSYSGDDTCHLWGAGIPCLLYGPGGGSESDTIPDEYVRISDMNPSGQGPSPNRPGRVQSAQVAGTLQAIPALLACGSGLQGISRTQTSR